MAWRMRARHRLREPETAVDRASDEEIVALLRACRSARDRLIVLLMARAGLRRGEVCGLRRSDVHLLADSRRLGCEVARAHLHVIRREDNPNGAWAKSRRQRVVPLDFLTVQAFDTYEFERMRVPQAAASDFVLVNLFRGQVGAPMRPDAIGELLAAASRRAGLDVPVSPHQLRHAYGSNAADAGAGIDVVADLLGHAAISSSQVYVHPGSSRLRAAVDAVPSPREQRRRQPVTAAALAKTPPAAGASSEFPHVLERGRPGRRSRPPGRDARPGTAGGGRVGSGDADLVPARAAPAAGPPGVPGRRMHRNRPQRLSRRVLPVLYPAAAAGDERHRHRRRRAAARSARARRALRGAGMPVQADGAAGSDVRTARRAVPQPADAHSLGAVPHRPVGTAPAATSGVPGAGVHALGRRRRRLLQYPLPAVARGPAGQRRGG